MVITYHGLEFFKLQVGDLVVAFNAPSKDSDIKISRFGADIALATLRHEDMDGGADLSRGDKAPFFIKGPGEYEVGGVFVRGFQGVSAYGGKEMINTIYTLGLDNMNVCFLGAQNSKALPEKLREAGDIDVLFVPVGNEGDGVFTPAQAYQTAVSLEPKIIIPTHYDAKSLATFLKEGSQNSADQVEKLTIKRKDIDGKQGEIIVIKQS